MVKLQKTKTTNESVASKVIKGEISVLSNTLSVQVGSSTRNYLGATMPIVDLFRYQLHEENGEVLFISVQELYEAEPAWTHSQLSLRS